MHVPPQLDPIERALAERLPHLRGPQRRGLALWVLGAVLAQSACEAAVLAALLPWAPYHALRQRLREWLRDGVEKRVPCARQVEVEACFAPLLRWVLGWWRGRELALAVDATAHRDDVVALVVSVLYRGSAIPVAWAVLPGNVPGAWMGPILRLLRRLRPAVPAGWTVLVLADRGLWSPRLWKRVRDLGWHPLLRIQRRTTIAPDGGERRPAGALVGPGGAWVGRGRAGRPDGLGAGRPRPVEPAAVEARPRPRLAPAAAHPAADDVRARRRRAPAGGSAGPPRRGLGRPRSARPAEGPGPDGHPGRGLDGGAGGALGRGHRPGAGSRRGELVCAAGLGRARLPGPQGCRLAVAALAPARSRPGRAALAGAGGGQPVGAGARHPRRGRARARPAAGPAALPSHTAGRRPPAPDQPVPAPVAAPPARARSTVASVVARSRALAPAPARI